MADAASLPLIISSLINIITTHLFSINFWKYALYMFIPNLVSAALSLLSLYLLYRKDLIKVYVLEVLN